MEPQELRNQLIKYVEENVGSFHKKRLDSLQLLSLDKVLKRKNPYLYRAKNLLTAEKIVCTILDAHLSSQEETMFGEFLEGLARHTCMLTKGGTKSSAEGIDLEFSDEKARYLLAIKSGPNWGNSSQIARMRDNFKRAKKIYGTNNPDSLQVIAVNGCCYGIDDCPNKTDYLKLCGQRFWEFLSGDPDLFKELIVPIGYKAQEKNDEFQLGYAKVINTFTVDFGQRFVKDGQIDWQAIVKLNSGSKHNF